MFFLSLHSFFCHKLGHILALARFLLLLHSIRGSICCFSFVIYAVWFHIATCRNLICYFLMSEPTNHLDLDTIEWLEGYLRKQAVPMVIIIPWQSFPGSFMYKNCRNRHGTFQDVCWKLFWVYFSKGIMDRSSICRMGKAAKGDWTYKGINKQIGSWS